MATGDWDDDYSHSVRGDTGVEPDDGYNLYGHGDPEGDLKRDPSPAAPWTRNFNDRRKKAKEQDV